MAIKEWYIDPAGTDDASAGRGETVGDPYATLDYALNTGVPATGQGANGDNFNLAAGTWVSTQNYATTTYFTSFTIGLTTAVRFKGAGDSLSILDGNGLYSIFQSTTIDYVSFSDCTLRNVGSRPIYQIDEFGSLINCIIHGCSGGTSAVLFDSDCEIRNCTVYDIASISAVRSAGDSGVNGCYFTDQTNAPSLQFLDMAVGTSTVLNNRFKLDSAYSGFCVKCFSRSSTVQNNSIYSGGASTGTGIYVRAGESSVCGNLVEGFSGVGGTGIASDFQFTMNFEACGNAIRNCTTGYENISEADGWTKAFDNETLGASPFADAANGDFTPVDVGNVWGGGWPQVGGSQPDKGAVQRLAGGAAPVVIASGGPFQTAFI